MATTKITVTVDDDQLVAIRDLVAAGKAGSVSGSVRHAIAVALDDVAGWHVSLEEALAASGGALTDEERAWADEVLGVTRRSVA